MAQHNRGLFAIAIFKWCNGLLLCAIALGLLNLLHRDPGDVAERWLRWLRVDPNNEGLGWILQKLSLIDDPKIVALSAVSFAYCGLFMVEGVGLYLEKRWAEYLTIIATASLLPFEIYELIKQIDAAKISLLVINLAILVFLIIIVRQNNQTHRHKR